MVPLRLQLFPLPLRFQFAGMGQNLDCIARPGELRLQCLSSTNVPPPYALLPTGIAVVFFSALARRGTLTLSSPLLR